MSILSIKEFAEEQAKFVVQAIAVAQRNGMINTEEDLTAMVAAGIETAIEEFLEKTEALGTDETEGV